MLRQLSTHGRGLALLRKDSGRTLASAALSTLSELHQQRWACRNSAAPLCRWLLSAPPSPAFSSSQQQLFQSLPCRPFSSSAAAVAEAPAFATPAFSVVTQTAAEAAAPLVITEKAVKRLLLLRKKKLAEGQPDNLSLRVQVDSGGCSGFKYSFQIENADPGEEDVLIEKGGARIVADSITLEKISGSTIDWVEEMAKTAFVIASNPNAASSCGCGSSFTAKD